MILNWAPGTMLKYLINCILHSGRLMYHISEPGTEENRFSNCLRN